MYIQVNYETSTNNLLPCLSLTIPSSSVSFNYLSDTGFAHTISVVFTPHKKLSD